MVQGMGGYSLHSLLPLPPPPTSHLAQDLPRLTWSLRAVEGKEGQLFRFLVRNYFTLHLRERNSIFFFPKATIIYLFIGGIIDFSFPILPVGVLLRKRF